MSPCYRENAYCRAESALTFNVLKQCEQSCWNSELWCVETVKECDKSFYYKEQCGHVFGYNFVDRNFIF